MADITKLAFVDLETTGLDPFRYDRAADMLVSWHEIIEIGAVLVDMKTGSALPEEFCRKVKPRYPERMEISAQRVNGYREEAWTNAEPLDAALNDFLQFLSGSMLWGSNIAFDWSFLKTAFMQVGYTGEVLDRYFHYSKRELTSFALGRMLQCAPPLTLDSLRTSTMLSRFGIEDEPMPHTAINGARKMRELFLCAWSRQRFRTD